MIAYVYVYLTLFVFLQEILDNDKTGTKQHIILKFKRLTQFLDKTIPSFYIEFNYNRASHEANRLRYEMFAVRYDGDIFPFYKSNELMGKNPLHFAAASFENKDIFESSEIVNYIIEFHENDQFFGATNISRNEMDKIIGNCSDLNEQEIKPEKSNKPEIFHYLVSLEEKQIKLNKHKRKQSSNINSNTTTNQTLTTTTNTSNSSFDSSTNNQHTAVINTGTPTYKTKPTNNIIHPPYKPLHSHTKSSKSQSELNSIFKYHKQSTTSTKIIKDNVPKKIIDSYIGFTPTKIPSKTIKSTKTVSIKKTSDNKLNN